MQHPPGHYTAVATNFVHSCGLRRDGTVGCFDGNDPQQVRDARALIDDYGGKVKPILVAGSYLDLMKVWQLSVYFDQQGVLTTKFGITQVPALVSQEGMRLRIDEFKVGR